MKKQPDDPFDIKRICALLVKRRLISVDQAKEALKGREAVLRGLQKQQAKNGASESRINNPVTSVDVLAAMHLKRRDVEDGVLEEETIFQVLAEAWGYDYKKIDPLKLDLNLVTNTIPRSFAIRHLVLPIAIKNNTLMVAMTNPFDREVLEDIARASNIQVKPVISSKTDIVKTINEFFGFKRSIAAAEHQFTSPAGVDLGNLEQYVRLKSVEEIATDDHHLVNAVNHLLVYAFDQRASDIHVEPKREASLVRLRIDGILHTVYTLPKNLHSAIVTRIKALARMDMAEKRKPQDGRIKTDKDGMEVEIRVSTVPVAFGEKIVMRIMDPDILFQDLEKLGFTGTDLIRYNRFIKMPHGIVLVCGPTGSGKSTTLYSTLRTLSTPDINITTVEDPIEMVHEDFNQIAVQPAVGITFSTILRTILRQDPDIIMIGEMRDLETAENAVQAALTGHLVLSTLHTNDAPSTIVRLLDLGVPSFLIQATLVGILAQRLVRQICAHCKESYDIKATELVDMGLTGITEAQTLRLWRGKGCYRCRGTGYRGRIGIFEVLPYSASLKKLTTGTTDIETLKATAVKDGLITMRENAIVKLLEGRTTYQEVLRVTWEQQDSP